MVSCPWAALVKTADIAVLVETWLSKGQCDMQEWQLSGYTHHALCHPRRGGKGRPSAGISVYVRNSLDKHVSIVASDLSLGVLYLKISSVLPTSRPDILLACCYLPTSAGDPFVDLMHGLAMHGRGCTLLVVGDLNARTGQLRDIPLPQDKINSDDPHNLVDRDMALVPRHRANRDMLVNPRGRSCVDLCLSSGMAIVNGRTPGDLSGAFTVFSKSKQAANSTPDLILASAALFPHFAELVVGKPEIWDSMSDHVPVTLHLKNVSWGGGQRLHPNIPKLQLSSINKPGHVSLPRSERPMCRLVSMQSPIKSRRLLSLSTLPSAVLELF